MTDRRDGRQSFFPTAEAVEGKDMYDTRSGHDGVASVSVPVNMLDIARRLEQERQKAKDVLQPYIERPLMFLWPENANVPELQTAGAVRVLCDAAHDACARRALDALTLADAALSIVVKLSDSHYLGRAIFLLHATAWRERGTALWLLSRFDEALAAVRCAEKALELGPATPLDEALVVYLRAAIFADTQRFSEADENVRTCIHVFKQIGDKERWRKSLLLHGAIRYRTGDYAGAHDTWAALLREQTRSCDDSLNARLFNNLAKTEIHLGRFEAAAEHFSRALELHDAAGSHQEALRTRWGIGELALFSGRYEEAIARLRAVVEQLEQQELLSEAVLARIDLAEALVAVNRPREARDLCHGLVRRCRAAGLDGPALIAAAYLRDLERTLSRDQLRYVRRFLEDAQRNAPNEFAPPPASS